MYNAAEKFTQTVRLCASQFVQPCTAHCNVFLIELLAKPTDAQLFTRQSSAKQTQANSPQAYRQLLKRYKPDRPYRQTHFAPSLDSVASTGGYIVRSLPQTLYSLSVRRA